MGATGQAIESAEEIFLTYGIVAVFVALGVIAFFLILGLYIYHSFAWMTIAKKRKHKAPWLAWIPFANQAMRLQLGGFAWQWIFLILIPIFGWVPLYIMLVISSWRIFEDLKYPGWISLAPLLDFAGAEGVGFLLNLIVIGVVAWKEPDKKQAKRNSKKKK
jgi:hypothetical protein